MSATSQQLEKMKSNLLAAFKDLAMKVEGNTEENKKKIEKLKQRVEELEEYQVDMGDMIMYQRDIENIKITNFIASAVH